MLRTGGRKPIAALVKTAWSAAGFAGAGAARFGQFDGLLDPVLRAVGEMPAKIEAKRAVFRFDVFGGEPVPLGQGGLDPDAAAFKEVTPASAELRVALGGDPEQAWAAINSIRQSRTTPTVLRPDRKAAERGQVLHPWLDIA
jgi:hypothetical protein